jgi:hypothetical protein
MALIALSALTASRRGGVFVKPGSLHREAVKKRPGLETTTASCGGSSFEKAVPRRNLFQANYLVKI